MKYFAFAALFMVFAIQALALPAPNEATYKPEILAQAVSEAVTETAPETQTAIEPQAEPTPQPHTGAAKGKRAVIFYSAPIVPSYPTIYRTYSYVPYYSSVPLIF